MKTFVILIIALIIGLIMLAVVVVAYKASPTQPAQRLPISALSKSQSAKKEAIPLTPILGR